MPITTIIIDDEKPARDELAFLLKGFPEITLIGQGKNGVEAMTLIKEHSPDLVFLDVQMPGLDGFGVLRKLVERKMKVPHVVFATAFDHYAVQAFDVNAVDYVLKPFDKARIAKAIQRARKVMETQITTTERLEQLVNQLGSDVSFYKVGLQLFMEAGLIIVKRIVDKGKKVFLDLKIDDTPRTVQEAVRNIALR